ncbi:MAG: IS630 family transposase [Gemmatimonadetes bacterium]|nr:IS630 family transposase [Gemmatimonadota bacterium]
MANLFLLLEPLTRRCEVKVTECRTKKDWTRVMKDLVDLHYLGADRITLVMDSLSTHQKAALYEVFPPEEAKRIADKIQIHFTPKRGSWLNMAEIGLNILYRQCLDRRISTIQQLGKELKAWLRSREGNRPVVNWRLPTQDARIKLKRLYPSLLPG